MRHLHDDAAYFQFLDGLADDAAPVAAMKLACEFPTLRNEEAKAVYCDWRLARQSALAPLTHTAQKPAPDTPSILRA